MDYKNPFFLTVLDKGYNSVEAALVLIRNYNVPAETAAQQMGAPLDMVLTELERTDVN